MANQKRYDQNRYNQDTYNQNRYNQNGYASGREEDHCDQIHIHGLEVYCNHGVYPEENILGQKFVLDIVLYTDTRRAGQTDQIEDSVNYGQVCQYLEEQMKAQNDKLLERVAQRMAEGILREFSLVRAVDVEVKKPWAPVMRHIDYASVAIHRSRHRVYVGLGSNMGDRERYIRDAIAAMDALEDVWVAENASLIETEPYGYVEQDRFLNTVVGLDTLLEPMDLLRKLQEIERRAGRTREIHWGPRTLDLDILLYDREILTDPELIVPHPEIEKRMFVLDSLCELIPYEIHPLLGRRFIQLKEALSQQGG